MLVNRPLLRKRDNVPTVSLTTNRSGGLARNYTGEISAKVGIGSFGRLGQHHPKAPVGL
ncbi:MAG TPA: hypothetical protein VK404_04120 [Spirosoma sp.]|nr:hypothetical protein [Spirosoma sp.]